LIDLSSIGLGLIRRKSRGSFSTPNEAKAFASKLVFKEIERLSKKDDPSLLIKGSTEITKDYDIEKNRQSLTGTNERVVEI
jgi:hypothetical protein